MAGCKYRELYMRFERGELFMLLLTGGIFAAVIGLVFVKGFDVNVKAYSAAFLFNGLFLAIGQFYRIVRKDEKIASLVTVLGLLLVSGNLLEVLTYQMLPYAFPSQDAFFAGVDGMFGFVWADYVIWMSGYPTFAAILKYVYLSCGWQIAAIIGVLAFTGKGNEAAKFMLALAIGGIVTILIWSLFPSSTPAAFQALPPHVQSALGLVVSPEQGQWLVQVSKTGLRHLSPEMFVGVVGFPSYHTVLAACCAWYARKAGIVAYPVYGLSILMVPAILLHGSHNIIDVIGGLVVTVVSVYMAHRIAEAGNLPIFGIVRPEGFAKAGVA